MNHARLTLLLSLTLVLPSARLVADDASVVAPGAEVKKLAGGMKFTEGPVWLPGQEVAGLLGYSQQQIDAVEREGRTLCVPQERKTPTGTYWISKDASFPVSTAPVT